MHFTTEPVNMRRWSCRRAVGSSGMKRMRSHSPGASARITRRGAVGVGVAPHDNFVLCLLDRFDRLAETDGLPQPTRQPHGELLGAADEELLLRAALDPGIALEASASAKGEEEVEER